MSGYLRFPPPATQRDAVEHYWMVEMPGSPTELKQQILIPNGRPGLAVALAEPGTRQDPLSGATWVNDAALFGIMTRPHVLSQTGMSSYVGAELKPWGIAALDLPERPAGGPPDRPAAGGPPDRPVVRVLPDRLVDGVLPLADWVGAGATKSLAEQLADVEFGPERAARLAAFVESWLQPVRGIDRLSRVVAVIEESHGAVAVAELAAVVGVSYSSLYRVFAGATGIGPKQFGEIVRYFRFVGGLLDGPADATAVLAALHGYYDQAHAARDFKRYTGVSATSFRAVQDGIAALMHGRSVQDV
ncbi:helix-turn-helix domain-containing protein [Kribbella sp. NPDC051620]|uniref:helix-turn-helix domain-containing protein n=1 Tax=Kribbella sp. NPDC051620 TaxID=3364120 RepID=UPI00379BF532